MYSDVHERIKGSNFNQIVPGFIGQKIYINMLVSYVLPDQPGHKAAELDFFLIKILTQKIISRLQFVLIRIWVNKYKLNKMAALS